MSKESKLFKNTVIIAIGNICTKCISFFLLPLYTSILTTEEYGKVDLVATYVTLLTIILTLQFEQGLFRFLIEARENEDKKIKYITTTLISIFFVTGIFAVVTTSILVKIKYEFTFYLIMWTVISVINSLIIQIPRGIGDNATYTKGSFISASLNVIFNALFIAVFKLGMKSLLISSVLSLALSVMYVFLKLKVWQYINLKMFSKEYFIEISKYSLPLIPYTLCWWVISASDRIIINLFIGTAANGIYAAAYKFPSLFRMITNIFQLSWTESASESINDERREEYYQKIIMNTIKFYSSCNLLIICVMPFVFDILIKSDFVEAYKYIPILMFAALFHSISSLYCSIYFAFKETKKVALTTIASATINVVVNILFIKKIGLYAAAISSALAYIIVNIISHIDIQRLTRIKISKKYLIKELLLYSIAIIIYYSNIRIAQAIVFLSACVCSFIQNKEIIYSIIENIKIKMNNLRFFENDKNNL